MNVPPNWKIKEKSQSPYDAVQCTCVAPSGKIQYMYHPLWVLLRDLVKFKRILRFCVKLKAFKPNKTQLSGIIYLMINTCIRTGGGSGDDDHRGMMSLLRGNAVRKGSGVHLKFVGKSGIRHCIHVRDRRSREFLKSLLSKPGKNTDKLFTESASTLNAYVKKTFGNDFTCKDIRTCQANIRMVEMLRKSSGLEPKEAITQAREASAKLLGHSVAISKKNYVCEGIITAYTNNPKKFHSSRDTNAVLKHCLKEYLEPI